MDLSVPGIVVEQEFSFLEQNIIFIHICFIICDRIDSRNAASFRSHLYEKTK
jgi:hypothetical protein